MVITDGGKNPKPQKLQTKKLSGPSSAFPNSGTLTPVEANCSFQLWRLVALHPTRRAPADPAKPPSLPVLSGGAATPALRARGTGNAFGLFQRLRQRTGISGNAVSTTAIALLAAPLLTPQENWITAVQV